MNRIVKAIIQRLDAQLAMLALLLTLEPDARTDMIFHHRWVYPTNAWRGDITSEK